MDNHSKYMLLAILFAFFGFITLGGLIYSAVYQSAFYWIPVVVNTGVYAWIVRALYKKSNE